MGGKISRLTGRRTEHSMVAEHDTCDCLDNAASESGVSVGWSEDESFARSDGETLSESWADIPSSSRETTLGSEWGSCDSLGGTDVFGDSYRTPDSSMDDVNGSSGTACQQLDQYLSSPGTLNSGCMLSSHDTLNSGCMLSSPGTFNSGCMLSSPGTLYSGCMTLLETMKQENIACQFVRPQLPRVRPDVDTTTLVVEPTPETDLAYTGGKRFMSPTRYLQDESPRDKTKPSLCPSPTWDQGDDCQHPYGNAGVTKSPTFKTSIGETAFGSNVLGNTSFDESTFDESSCSSSLDHSLWDDADGAVCLNSTRKVQQATRHSDKRTREGTPPSPNTIVSCHGNDFINNDENIQQNKPLESDGRPMKESTGQQIDLSCRYVQQLGESSIIVRFRHRINRSCSDFARLNVERRSGRREKGRKEDFDNQRNSYEERHASENGSLVGDVVETHGLDNTTRYTSGVHFGDPDLAMTCDFKNTFQPWEIPQNILSGATSESTFGNTNNSYIICTAPEGSHNVYITDPKPRNGRSRSLVPVADDKQNTRGENSNASHTIWNSVQIHTNKNDGLADNSINILKSTGKSTSGFSQHDSADTCAGIPGSILVESMKLPSNDKPPTDKGSYFCASVEETSKLTRYSRLEGKLAGILPSHHIKSISRGGNTGITEYCDIDWCAELQRDGEKFDRSSVESSVEVSQPSTVINGDCCFAVTTGVLSSISDTPSDVSNKHFLLGNIFKCSPSVLSTTGSAQTNDNTSGELDNSAEVICQPSSASSSFQVHEADPNISTMKEKVDYHNHIDAVSDLAVFDQAHPSVIKGLSLADTTTDKLWTHMCASSPLDELKAQLFLISDTGLKATGENLEVWGQYLDQARAIMQLRLLDSDVLCDNVSDNHDIAGKHLTNQSFRDYHQEVRAAEPAGKREKLTLTRSDNLSSSVIRELYDNDYDFSTKDFSTESKPNARSRHRVYPRKSCQMKANSLWTLLEEPENDSADISCNSPPNPPLVKPLPTTQAIIVTATISTFVAGQKTLERKELTYPRQEPTCPSQEPTCPRQEQTSPCLELTYPRRFDSEKTKCVQLSSLDQKLSPHESSVCAKNNCTYSLRTEHDPSSGFGSRQMPLTASPESADQGKQAHVSTGLANASKTKSDYLSEIPDGLSVLDRLSLSLAQFHTLTTTTTTTTKNYGSECQLPHPKEARSSLTKQPTENYPQTFEPSPIHGVPLGHSYTTCQEERTPNGGCSLYCCTGYAEVRTTAFPDYDNTTETLIRRFIPDLKSKTAVVRRKDNVKKVHFKQSVDTRELGTEQTDDSSDDSSVLANSDNMPSGCNHYPESNLRVLYRDCAAAESEKAEKACEVAQEQSTSTFRLKRFLGKSQSKQKSGRRLMKFLSKFGCVSDSTCCPEESPKKISQKVVKKSKKSSKITISDPVLIRSTSFRHHSSLASSIHTSTSTSTSTDNYSSTSSSNHSFDSEPSIADSAYSSNLESVNGSPSSPNSQCLCSSLPCVPRAPSSPVEQSGTSEPLLGGKTFPGDPVASNSEAKMLHVDADNSQSLTSNCLDDANPDKMSAVSNILKQLDICESEIDAALLDHLRHGHRPVIGQL